MLVESDIEDRTYEEKNTDEYLKNPHDFWLMQTRLMDMTDSVNIPDDTRTMGYYHRKY
jgi:hypothetical protein